MIRRLRRMIPTPLDHWDYALRYSPGSNINTSSNHLQTGWRVHRMAHVESGVGSFEPTMAQVVVTDRIIVQVEHEGLEDHDVPVSRQ